jgi:hypothetical protein
MPVAAVARIRCGRRLVWSAGWGRPGRVVACSRAAQRKSAFRRLAARRPLLFPAGMSRYGQPGARTRLFCGSGMRIRRSLITYRNTGQVGALPDIKGQSRWPLRFPGRRDRRRRGRLLSTVRTGLVLITHRSRPLRQDPGVPVDSRANPPPHSSRPLRRDLARAGRPFNRVGRGKLGMACSGFPA